MAGEDDLIERIYDHEFALTLNVTKIQLITKNREK